MLTILEGAVFLSAIVLYLIPSIIADARGRHDAFAVTMVNVLLGWTIVGWFAAFTWARQPISERRLIRAGWATRRVIVRMTVARARHRTRAMVVSRSRLVTVEARARANGSSGDHR
jgi:hypothetical protein